MKTLSFSHIGIAVKDMEKALKLYTEDLGIPPENIKTAGMPGVMSLANITIGNERIELLEFHEKEKNPIATIGEERDHFVQHIGIYVESVAQAMEEFRAKGATMVDKVPRVMPDGHTIGFVIPKDTEMLIELMQK